MLFNIHPVNLIQVKAVIRTFGVCWFHGDGNMYHIEKESDDHRQFTNPGRNNTKPAASFRAKFTSPDQVPDTVPKMEEVLLRQNNIEEKAERMKEEKAGQVINTFKVSEEDEEPVKKGKKASAEPVE